jgi:hypothetical protein
MAEFSHARRKLFMHPAHRTVGVSGDGVATGPYCRSQGFSTSSPLISATRIALAARQFDADACAAMELFQRAIEQRCDMDCRHVDLDVVNKGSDSLADADCIVIFGRGLRMARHWSDLDVLLMDCPDFRVSENGTVPFRPRDDDLVEIELAAGARWHPVLAGVKPFTSCHNLAQAACIPAETTVLLVGRTAEAVWPVAWAWQGSHGNVFHATLGSAADFHHPAFVRLVLNALAWIGR